MWRSWLWLWLSIEGRLVTGGNNSYDCSLSRTQFRIEEYRC